MVRSDGLEVNFLKQRAHTLSRALFFRLDEYVEDFPTGEPLHLINLFKRVAVETDETIESTSDINRLVLIGQTLAELSNYAMSLLDHANTAQTPRGLAQMLWELQERIFPGSVIFVTPLADYNYTIGNHYPSLKNALRSKLIPAATWDEISKRYATGFSVVRFPRIERENILLHTVFGHEFGHPIAAAFLSEERESDDYRTELAKRQNLISEEFATELSQEADPLRRLKLHAELSNAVTVLRQRGLEELISDVVAAMLFGVSALFATAEILVPEGLDFAPQKPEFYPPSRLRLRVICNVLDNSGHLDALRQTTALVDSVNIVAAANTYVESLQTIVGMDSDQQAIQQDPLVRIAYEWLDQTLDRAKYFAEDRIRSISYDLKRVEEELSESIQRICLGVPPSETGTFPNVAKVDWRTALVAGWVYKIHLRDSESISWDARQSAIADAQARALKGVEDSLLRGAYLLSFVDALADH